MLVDPTSMPTPEQPVGRALARSGATFGRPRRLHRTKDSDATDVAASRRGLSVGRQEVACRGYPHARCRGPLHCGERDSAATGVSADIELKEAPAALHGSPGWRDQSQCQPLACLMPAQVCAYVSCTRCSRAEAQQAQRGRAPSCGPWAGIVVSGLLGRELISRWGLSIHSAPIPSGMGGMSVGHLLG